MAFRVGQKVALRHDIDGWHCSTENDPPLMPMPVEGQVYTISEIVDGVVTTMLRLVELNERCLFEADAFRPVKTTDISVFRAMLTKAPTESIDA